MAVTIRAGADPHGPQRATEHEQPGPARRARHQDFQLSRSMRPRQPSGLVPWHRRWEPSVVAPVEVEPVRIDAAGSVAGVSTAVALLLAAAMAVKGGLGGRLLRVRVCRLRGSHRDHDDPQPPRPRPGHARRAGRRHPPGTSGTPVDGHARGRLDEPVARLPAAAPRRRDPSRCRKLMGRARTERPTRAATLAVYGRRGRRRACDLLARECSRHGVPFTTNGITMLTNAPPGSPYRVATPRHRR